MRELQRKHTYFFHEQIVGTNMNVHDASGEVSEMLLERIQKFVGYTLNKDGSYNIELFRDGLETDWPGKILPMTGKLFEQRT
jgi:hypothetical protein